MSLRFLSASGRTRQPGFREALAFEWTKFASVRSTVWTTASMAPLMVAFAVFVAATESLQPDDTVLGGSLTGSVIMLMVAGVVGALTVCGEYASGTIGSTLAAVPSRIRVFTAKATLVSGLLSAIALLSCVAAYQVGHALLPEDQYPAGEPMPALLGIAALFGMVGVFGLAVGTLLRHAAGAVALVVGVMLLPSLFGPLLGDLQPWVVGATPTTVLEKLTQTSDADPEAVGSLGGWPSLLLVCAYTLPLAVLAVWRLRRRTPQG